MAQEFFINSQELEDKIRQLLPSQGGQGAGFDLSATTQIVPIIDLTESAEGSNVRADLQTALSQTSVTEFRIINASNTTIVNNTGYYRIFGNYSDSGTGFGFFELTDGVTAKKILQFNGFTANAVEVPFDFNIFLKAGDSLIASAGANGLLEGCSRQLADVDGNLTSP